jgi:uncharacterized protein (DUF58 family)
VSTQAGSGLEFHDYRPYAPGDDPGDIDWKLFGRTDRHYVRRHQRLTDLHLTILLDVSASMDFAPGRAPAPGSGSGSGLGSINKAHYAATLAASLAFLAIRQGDRAGLALAAEKITDYRPPAGSWDDLQHLCLMLENATAKPLEGRGDLGTAITQLHTLLHRRGMVVVISDLLDDPAGLFDGLERLRHDRCDVIVFQVLTPVEMNLQGAPVSHARWVDAETGEHISVAASQVAAGYTQLLHEHGAKIQRFCSSRGIDYSLLTTDQPIPQGLRRYLARRYHG